MSSIAITGNAAGAGVFTIASPNSASSYTITLPTVTGGSFIASDASGNVGIGTSSPTSPLTLGNNKRIAGLNTGGSVVNFAIVDGSNNVYLGDFSPNTSNTNLSGASNVIFGTGNSNTERMRIDSSGYLLVNQTSNTTNSYVQIYGAQPALSVESTSTGGVNQIIIRNPNGTVGSISTSGSLTSYNVSSDYRLKNTIAPMTGALAKVALLKPCTYKWNVDGSDGQGFIAHELDEVIPGCVTGEKDAVETYTDENGNEATRPAYQGIDTSFLVATLTAAIQELKAEFDAYKAAHP